MKNNNDKQQQIGRQIDALTRAFGALSVDNGTAWRTFRRAEKKMRRASEMYLSEPGYGRERMQATILSVRQSVVKCFKEHGKIDLWLHVCTDPRGYALKVPEDIFHTGIFTDMGGDGILAPEF